MTGDEPWTVEFARQLSNELQFLHRAAWRWCRQRTDVDDLVQDTLLRALSHARSWQADSNLRAWLVVIMRNQFFAGRQKSTRTAEANDEFAAAVPDRVANDGEARLVMRDVEGALHRLPRKQRSAVLLVGVEGSSYEEAAQATGMSVGAVRSDLARARSRLREAIQGTDAPTLFVRPEPQAS